MAKCPTNRLLLVLIPFLFLLALPCDAQCPAQPAANISSPQIPTDVCIPPGFGGNPINFFDDFSWRSFIAMVWPNANGERGSADTSLTVGSLTDIEHSQWRARVFETYKSLWEIFNTPGANPAPWDIYDSGTHNACLANTKFGDLVLASFSKFSDIGQAGFGNLTGPLIAQNRTYVRYLTSFNKAEFDQILTKKLYLRKNLPPNAPAVTFDNGAIDLKSAWIEMKDVVHPERYYRRTALVLDPANGSCSEVTVGLVGLHIVQKTPSRPQWIWTTFEQIDNVPPQLPGALPQFMFNDGTGTPMPNKNPFPIDPLPPQVPPPFNVSRLKSIDSRTQDTNARYQQALKAQNSVWQFYALVMTQWPLPPEGAPVQGPVPPDQDGTPANTFPGTAGATTSFANATMETFEQGDVTKGCMACHDRVGKRTDFLWSLNDHASPPNVPNLLFDRSFRALQDLLKSSTVHQSTKKQPGATINNR